MPTFGGMIIHAERAIDRIIDIHRVQLERKTFKKKLGYLGGGVQLLGNVKK